MKRVTVLGGGGTGCAMAAHLTMKGMDVTLWEDRRWWHGLEDIQRIGYVEMEGAVVEGKAVISHLSDDLAQAVEGAQIILVAMIATRHQALCQALAPLLKPGQAVCFSAGNCGSYRLWKALGEDSGVLVGEMQGNVYPCRLIGPASVTCAFPYAPKKVAAFPARDTQALIEAMAPVYECVPAGNIWETTFNSPNTSIHLAGSLLNLTGVEKDPGYRMYAQGVTPGVVTCIEAVEAEKAAVMERIGFPMAVHAGTMRSLLEPEKHPELARFRQLAGPSSMDHRYINEDASHGQMLLISLADALGVPVPTMKALVHLAGVVNKRDYRDGGLDLAFFGLEGATPEEMKNYLQTGHK